MLVSWSEEEVFEDVDADVDVDAGSEVSSWLVLADVKSLVVLWSWELVALEMLLVFVPLVVLLPACWQ